MILICTNVALLKDVNRVGRQGERKCMVDLVGRHDILFMYVVISGAVIILFLLESLFNFRGHFFNLAYFAWNTNLTLNDLMAS